jgi:hypothetical protein
MANGTSLRVALQRHGLTLDKSQIRALYRNRDFRRMYQECGTAVSMTPQLGSPYSLTCFPAEPNMNAKCQAPTL